jgi:hypothetical protein
MKCDGQTTLLNYQAFVCLPLPIPTAVRRLQVLISHSGGIFFSAAATMDAAAAYPSKRGGMPWTTAHAELQIVFFRIII